MMRREMEERGSRRGRRGLFRNGLLVAVAEIVATALPAEEIPAASPEEVGMSSEASSSKPVLAVAAMISEVLSGRSPVYPVNHIE